MSKGTQMHWWSQASSKQYEFEQIMHLGTMGFVILATMKLLSPDYLYNYIVLLVGHINTQKAVPTR